MLHDSLVVAPESSLHPLEHQQVPCVLDGEMADPVTAGLAVAMPASSVSIVVLPPELITKIFKYMPLRDLIACSLVNKKWNLIYSGLAMRLFAFRHPQSDQFPFWYGTNHLILNTSLLCTPKMFRLLALKLMPPNIKYLSLAGVLPPPDLTGNMLGNFQSLVHLEVNFHRFIFVNRIEHPVLKVLALHCKNTQSIEIACPELRILKYGEREGPSLLTILNPQTVRHLETNMFGPKLSPFTRVETLVTRQVAAITLNTLTALRSLRQFKFNGKFNLNEQDAQIAKLDLTHFVRDAQRLQGTFEFTMDNVTHEMIIGGNFILPIGELADF